MSRCDCPICKEVDAALDELNDWMPATAVDMVRVILAIAGVVAFMTAVVLIVRVGG